MAKKEIVQVNLAAGNPNLSPATTFGDLVFSSTAGFQGSLSGV